MRIRNIRHKSKASRLSSYACEALEHRRLLALVVPAYNSRPGAFQTLYLDFDGSAAFAWDNGTAYTVRGPNSSAQFPAAVPGFSLDGDFNNFSAAETTAINHICQWAAEKFSPFTINVTTVNPNIVQDGRTMTCIIGGSPGDWLGGTAGGVSDINGFWDGGENTCFAFSAGAVNNGLTGSRLDQFLGETIAHEAGHEVGLLHQRSPGTEYYPGDIFRAPIMGGSSNNTQGRGIWWLTDSFSGQNSGDPVQNDLATLTQGSDRLSFAADTGGGSISLDGAGKVITATGIINGVSDVDSFTFTATGAHATFTIKNFQYGGMLAPTVKIRISGTSTYVSATTVTANTNASIDTSNLVVGGNYVLEVGSRGNYGDIGQYTVDGSETVFAAYDAASRTVNVGGFAGNNNVTISASGNTLTIQDSVNGGATATQTFTLSAVDSVNVHLGAGDDRLNCVGISKADTSALPLFIFMGGGFDTLNLGGGSTFLTFDVGAITMDVSFAGGVRRAQFWNYDAERIEIHGTSSDNDRFNINSVSTYGNVYAYGDQGADSMVVSPEVMASNTNAVIFYGEAGSDTLELNGSTLADPQSFIMFGSDIQRFLPTSPFASEVQFDSTLETFNIKGGGGDDSFQLLGVATGKTVNVTGNGGNDTFRFGKSNQPAGFELPFSGNIFGTINVSAGLGNDLIYIDDVAWAGGLSSAFSIAGTFISGGVLTQATVTFDGNLESLEFHASNTRAGSMTLFGLHAFPILHLIGGAGNSDVLIIDDRSLQIVPFRVDLGADSYTEYYGTPQSPTILSLTDAPGFEQMKFSSHASTNAINVTGVPATRSLTVTAGANADTITVYPHDANGNLTINFDLVLQGGGGSDKVIIDDSASSSPINYLFTNTFAGLIDRISGMGAGVLSPFSDVENTTIKGGGGNDTFDFNGHKLSNGVAIYGGGGSDVLNFGGGDLIANVANLTSFFFDGEDGADTLNLNNTINGSVWQYGVLSGSMTATQSTYTAQLSYLNAEQLRINAGGNNDATVVSGLPTAVLLSVLGGLGNDTLGIGGAAANLETIHGPIEFDGGGGADNRVTATDTNDTTGDIGHIDQNTVGAYPGDNLFGAGGSLKFVSIARLDLNCGSGADTIYAQPNLSTLLFINASSPGVAPGDSINLALATAVGYSVNGTPASGNVTSSNLKTLTYTGFESGPNIDAAAPTVLAANIDINGAPPAAPALGMAASSFGAASGPSLDVQFSEAVALLLGAGVIQLTNLTTGQIVPQGFIAMTYDPATRIAHFTFPGYPQNTLPDGNYQGKVLAGSTGDLFGNALVADAPFSFFVLAGDANHDRSVDAADLTALGANWQGAGRTFSQGDFNYDGVVDISDLYILSTKWQQTLPPPPPAAVPVATVRPVRTPVRVAKTVL